MQKLATTVDNSGEIYDSILLFPKVVNFSSSKWFENPHRYSTLPSIYELPPLHYINIGVKFEKIST